MNPSDTPPPPPRSPFARWALGSAVATFAVTRLAILFLLTPAYSDVLLYFDYATHGVDLGLAPYADMRVEYPPAAYWAMAAPRLVDPRRLTREELEGPGARAALASYHRGFRRQMLLVEAGCFALVLLLAARRWPGRAADAAWAYVLVTTPLAHLLFDRLDLGMLLLLLSFAYAWTRGAETTERSASWTRMASIALGLSVAYKLVSVVAVPFVLLALWRNAPRRADAVRGAVVLAAAIALPFAAHWPSAGARSLDFLKYHGERGIEIESLYASGLMLLRPLSVEVHTVLSHGGTNLEGGLTGAAATASTWLLLGVLAALGGWAILRGRQYDLSSGLRYGCGAILATVLLSKVLSPQYLLFALPLWLVVALDVLRTRRQFVGLIVLACAAACLTTWVFPYHWNAEYLVDGQARVNDVYLVPDMKWQAVAVLALRNALLIGGTLWLIAASLRAPRRDPVLSSVEGDSRAGNRRPAER